MTQYFIFKLDFNKIHCSKQMIFILQFIFQIQTMTMFSN